ncbi:MAG: trigger factor [Rhodobacteraceae bacterium CG17_big_fil_post_rev_8_21_14_2_50_63_15]|nr:trigger factor [Roseovarius sp.]PIV79816.1 MAG: trigger factor [Rhodobacteraceae bacterium CG17_big_fil_post_rev_8_21_14_2_50_63_15]
MEALMRPRQLCDFEGVWAFRREIVEAQGAPIFVLGQTLWSPGEAGLVCEETGVLQKPGHPPMQVGRRTFWGPDLSVRFADGRVFHQVPGLGGAVSHWCDPDQYDGTYDFSEWPAFTVVWRVRGPRKDYQMQTRYWRRGDLSDERETRTD